MSGKNIITHPLKLTGDTIHFDHSDVNQGKGTMVFVAPNPDMFPESYALFHERAAIIVEMWNNKFKIQEFLAKKRPDVIVIDDFDENTGIGVNKSCTQCGSFNTSLNIGSSEYTCYNCGNKFN